MDDGVTYLKVGPGGKMSSINKACATFKTKPPPPWAAFRDNPHHRFAKLAVTPEGIYVDSYGVPAAASWRSSRTRCTTAPRARKRTSS